MMLGALFPLLSRAFLLVAVIWGIFRPLPAAIAHMCFAGMFEGYLLLTVLLRRPAVPNVTWSDGELAAIRKYQVYFTFPFASREFSSVASGVQMTTLFWSPWLLYKGHWILAVIVGVNYFVAGSLSMKLNPRFFLHEAVDKRRDLRYLDEMVAVDSVCEKIIAAQKRAHETVKPTEGAAT